MQRRHQRGAALMMGTGMRRWLTIIFVLGLCTSVNAQPRELIIAGIGATTCAHVLKSYREGPKAMSYLILTWAQGFWSSQNAMFLQAGAPLLRNLAGDDEAHIKGLMTACDGKPSVDFGIIVRDYFFELPGYRNPQAK
jgi:hypothetical protein